MARWLLTTFAMNLKLSGFIATALLSFHLQSADLVQVGSAQPPIPNSIGFEPNRGQANPGILFLNRSGIRSFSITSQAILFSPLGARLVLIGSQSAPQVTFEDTRPGTVNVYSGSDPQRWVTGVPLYGSVRLKGIYPGVDALYLARPEGPMVLRMIFAPGVNPQLAVFEIAKAVTFTSNAGGIIARLGLSHLDPALGFEAPIAYQETFAARVNRAASFQLLADKQFGFRIDQVDSSLPLNVEFTIDKAATSFITQTDSSGNLLLLGNLIDAGKDAPFPNEKWDDCGTRIAQPISCLDIAVYKYSPSGTLLFATYLSGKTTDAAKVLKISPDGTLVVAGSTDSSDFPISNAAAQKSYAGPAATYRNSDYSFGDFFVAKLDSINGALKASTYWGGPNPDTLGDVDLGSDGSVFLSPELFGRTPARMPATGGALQNQCSADPCPDGYIARLDSSLERPIYATYLPGTLGGVKPFSDGSLIFFGFTNGGFPATQGAYQTQFAGNQDGFLAKLDPNGTRLLFGTYYGKSASDDRIAEAIPAPDGTIWASVSSSSPFFSTYELVHFDGLASQVLQTKPYNSRLLSVDTNGNVFMTAAQTIVPSANALLSNFCHADALVKLNASGEQLFATYLPFGYSFLRPNERGNALLFNAGTTFELLEKQEGKTFAGCVVDGASFGNPDFFSPGGIVTIFGSKLGPVEGQGFQLEGDRVPVTLAGTQVLVNGTPIPLLYASYGQINAVLPYSLEVGSRPKIQVISNYGNGNEIANSTTQKTAISIFHVGDFQPRMAAALNEDGTVNSTQNPAKLGSAVALFGTGGGQTTPASTAGQITPIALVPLENEIRAVTGNNQKLTVEYAGGAPGLVSGVNQFNIRLPDTIPNNAYPVKGLLPISLVGGSGNSFTTILIAVK